MGHYDECRPGYCPACGAAPGNMKDGRCTFCVTKPKANPSLEQEQKARRKALKKKPPLHPWRI